MICDYPFKLQLLRVLCEKVAEAIFLFNQDDKILMNTLDYSLIGCVSINTVRRNYRFITSESLKFGGTSPMSVDFALFQPCNVQNEADRRSCLASCNLDCSAREDSGRSARMLE